jgi:hypothetical protein
VIVGPPPAAIPHSASSRLRLSCRKRSKGCALSPTSQLLLPCEDEIIENTVDFLLAITAFCKMRW